VDTKTGRYARALGGETMKKDNWSLLDFLSEGEENAKTAQELMRVLGYESVRMVAADVARLRKQGEIICCVSDGNFRGYFLPENRADVERFVRRTENRLRETERMLQPARDYLQGQDGD